jgi:hypothetical protein
MEPVKLLERAATTAVHAVRHPISSAAYAAGIARGLAGAAVHGVRAHGAGSDSSSTRPVPAQRPPESAAPEAPRKPQRVPKPVPSPDAFDDMVVIEPEPEHESFATEPKAVSRESAHGGRATDAEIDAWIDEAVRGADVDVETPVGTTGADVGHNPNTGEADLQQPDTEPLLDPATAKAIRSEAAIMQKAADPEKE